MSVYVQRPIYFDPGRVRSIAMSVFCLSVCMHTCPLAPKKLHVHISRNVLHTLPWPLLGSFLTAVYNTLCTSGCVDDVMLSHMVLVGQNQRRSCFVQFVRWRHRERSCCLRMPCWHDGLNWAGSPSISDPPTPLSD